MFVSYAHENSAQVYPELRRLREQGFNIWYDEGIAPGSSWREELAQAIDECALFLIFITPGSAVSENCQKEVNFAENHGRRVLAVHLVETKLSMGLELALSDRQAVMKYQLGEAAYYEKLESTLAGLVERGRVEPDASNDAPPSRSFPVVPLVAGMVLVAGIIAAIFVLNRQDEAPIAQAAPTPVAADIGMPDVPASTAPVLAVLPFENLSATKDTDYFASGMHQDVLFNLSKISNLQVIARNSVLGFAGSTQKTSDIAAELGASHLLTGSVRRAGNQVRISVSLIDNQDRQVWAERYDRKLEDIFAIQSEVANSIASALRISMEVGVAERIARRPTDNLEAYDLYMQGRDLMSADNSTNRDQALSMFEQAVAIAPDFAAAHAAIADSLIPANVNIWSGTGTEHRERARREAELALRLDDQSVPAHLAMARWLIAERRNEEAYAHLERAVRLDPSNSDARMLYGDAYVYNGDLVNALAQWEKAIDLDPLSPATNLQMADVYSQQGRSDEALAHAHRALELAPGNVAVATNVAFFYRREGMPFEAMELALALLREEPDAWGAQTIVRWGLNELGFTEPLKRWAARYPEDSQYYYLWMSSYYQGIDDRESRAEITDKWLTEQPDNLAAMQTRAFALSQLGQQARREERTAESVRLQGEALALLQKSLGADRSATGYRWRLDNQFAIAAEMVVAATLGDDTRASEIAEDLLAHAARQPFQGMHLWAGMAHLLLGNREAGLNEFRELGDSNFRWSALLDYYGVSTDDLDIFSGVADDVAYKDAMAKVEARNELLRARIRSELPEALTADIDAVGTRTP